MKINTKKITAVGIAALVFGTPVGAFADEDTTTLNVDTTIEVDTTDLEEQVLEVEVDIESNTTVELEDSEREHFLTKEGAELKWEQLSLRLEARVENAQTLISEISEDSEVDSEVLTEITIEFETILEEINSVNIEDSTTSDLAHLYVDYKKQIIDLSHDFKMEFAKGLSEEKKVELKEKVEAKKDEIKEKRQEKLVKLQVKHSMKNMAKAYASISDLDLDEIRAQYESGEITVEEIKTQLKESWSNLSEEEKEEAKEKLHEEKSRLQIELKERSQELKEERSERLTELKEKRSERLTEIKEKREKIKTEIKADIHEKRQIIVEQRAALNQKDFKSIENKFNSLTPEQQEKLKQRAEGLSEKEKERLNKIGEKYLRGEDLSEEDLAQIDVIVETSGGVDVALE